MLICKFLGIGQPLCRKGLIDFKRDPYQPRTDIHKIMGSHPTIPYDRKIHARERLGVVFMHRLLRSHNDSTGAKIPDAFADVMTSVCGVPKTVGSLPIFSTVNSERRMFIRIHIDHHVMLLLFLWVGTMEFTNSISDSNTPWPA